MPMLFDPFEQLRDFQRALDEFRSSGWLGSGMSAGGAYPPINIFRKGDDIVAIIEVPRVRKSDLDIRVERDTLRIAGSKTFDYGDKAAMHRRERSAGAVDRAVTLRSTSTPTRSRPNAATASSRSICRALNATSHERSPCPEQASCSENEPREGRMAKSQAPPTAGNDDTVAGAATTGKEGTRLEGGDDSTGALFRADDRHLQDRGRADRGHGGAGGRQGRDRHNHRERCLQDRGEDRSGEYDGMEPLYTEYNVGHFARSFALSNKIDRQQISAKLEDGVLTLTLKKAQEAIPRRSGRLTHIDLERP